MPRSSVRLILTAIVLGLLMSSFARAQKTSPRFVPEITIHADQDRGPVRLYTGWLHGFEESDPLPIAKVQALNTSAWRVSKLWQLSAVRPFTSNIQYEVSFSWRWQQLGNPAANLALWQQYLVSQVSYIQSNNLHVEWWDIWNEPDHAYFWQWSYSDLLKTYDAAVSTIKTLVPNAKFIGPSFARFVARDNFNGRSVANFIKDLDSRYGIRLDAVSWHMNDDWYPWNIQGNVDALRSAIDQIGGGYDPKLVINEYTQSLIVLRPVYLASFVWHMDQAGIDFANLACWNLYSNCFPQTTYSSCWVGLNGLFLKNYSAEQHSYWFYEWHGREKGNVRLEVSRPEINTFAIASRSDARQEIVICVGKHSHLDPVGGVILKIQGYPWGGGEAAVQVDVSELTAAHELCGNDVWKPKQVASPDGPTPVSSEVRSVVGGALTIRLPRFADDDLRFVTIRAASAR